MKIEHTQNHDHWQPDTPMQFISYYLKNAINSLKGTYNQGELLAYIQKALSIAEGLDPYIEKYSSTENELLQALAEKTKNTSWQKLFSEKRTKKLLSPVMLTGHYQGLILKTLANFMKAKKVLDIGMFTGYSTLAIASGLPKDGYVIACENEPFLVEFSKHFFDMSNYGKMIKIEMGPAIETLKKLAQQKERFDMIFIDADKKEYIDYYKLIMHEDLLSDHGIICVDNTLMKGFVYTKEESKWNEMAEAIIKFNKFVSEDNNVEQIILPIRDGITLIWKTENGRKKSA